MKDFTQHNEEAKRVWEAYEAGDPIRIPLTIGMNPRVVLLDDRYNNGVTFERYYNDPQVMLDTQMTFHKLIAFEVEYDHQMGLPADGWHVYLDFQNDVECGWLGAEVNYYDNAVPFTVPYMQDDANKRALLDKGRPGLFDGLIGKMMEFREFFLDKQKAGFEYEGRPIHSVGMPGLGMEGPMTVCCMLRGTTEYCIDLYEDEAYALELLDFITEASIYRIKGLRKHFGLPVQPASLGFADDSIQLLSCEDYERLILPSHKKLVRELTDMTGQNSIHLCGDATRHFKMIQDELNVHTFDTGYPIDFAKMLTELAPGTRINGGVHVNTLMRGTPGEIKADVERFCNEVKPLSKRFVMREANNLSPGTPMSNVKAMYDAVKEFGRFK